MLDDLDPHWVWMVVGLVLATAEMVVPGFFLIWLAGAALLTGLITGVLPIGLAGQLGVFAVLSVASVLAGRRWLRLKPIDSPDPLLNQRGAQLVGRGVVVVQAIEHGSGRVRLGDSEWLAQGPDSPVGARLTVTGHSGAVLIVEAVP